MCSHWHLTFVLRQDFLIVNWKLPACWNTTHSLLLILIPAIKYRLQGVVDGPFSSLQTQLVNYRVTVSPSGTMLLPTVLRSRRVVSANCEEKLKQPPVRIIIFVQLLIGQFIYRGSCDHTFSGSTRLDMRVCFKSPKLRPIPTLPGTFGVELTEEFTSVLFSLCFGGRYMTGKVQLINQTCRDGHLWSIPFDVDLDKPVLALTSRILHLREPQTSLKLLHTTAHACHHWAREP